MEGEGDARHGWCEVARRGHPPERRTFSVADAKRAKLWGKTGRNGAPTPWVTYPDRMLQMRARGFALRDVFPDALRDVFPDALRGVITVEEAQDIPAEPRFVPSTEAAPSPATDAVGAGGMIGLGEFKLPALRDALDGCATPDQLREYLGGAETWLARLRRTQPDRAREADAMVSAAWARVRGLEDAAAAVLPLWCIVGSDGKATEYRDAIDWLEHWRHRVDGIETAAFPVAARRRALERLLAANDAVLRRIGKHGSVAAALDATAAAAQADGRLAVQEQEQDSTAALPLAAE